MAAPMAALRRLSGSSVAAGLGKLLTASNDAKHLPLGGLLLRWPPFSTGNAVPVVHTGVLPQGWSHYCAQESSSVAHHRLQSWQNPPSAVVDTLLGWRVQQGQDGRPLTCATLGSSYSELESQSLPAPSLLLNLAAGRHCCTTTEHDCAAEYPFTGGTAAELQSSGAQPPNTHFHLKQSRILARTPAAWLSLSPGLHVRHFSQDVRAKPRVAQVRTLRLAAQSVNTVVEPYKKPRVLPLWRRWLTLEGWRVRKDNILSYLKTGYAIAKVKRAIPGYNVPLFFRDVTRLYLAINRALAAGDTGVLRGLVTERTLGQMKQELEVRRRGGWASVAWDLPDPAAMQCRTVHGRMVGVDPKNTSLAFAQVTVRLRSRQKFAAYDRKGHLLAGSPEQELEVEDHWVFERALWIKDAHWRLCGRLTL